MGTNNPNFPNNVLSDEDAIQYLGLMVQALKTNAYLAQSGAGPFTVTAAQMIGGVTEFSGSAAAVTVNTDTAANIQARMLALDANAGIGSTANWGVVNDNTSSGAITVTAGANVTVVGPTVAIASVAKYQVKWTAATTVSVTKIA